MTLTLSSARAELERQLSRLPDYPGGKSGRGVVICTGGEKYFTCAWVCLRMLRHHGCRLPVELWHLGPEEVAPWMRHATAGLSVKWVDARQVALQHPARILNGWELKPYAILHSRFAEVLSLDSDNVPVRDPTYLFDAPEYREHGAVFWPDFGRLAPERAIWALTGVPYRDEPEFESGQVLVDKTRCWRELSLTLWFNEHSDFWYQHVLGDKETFHFAWRKLERAYAMPTRAIYHLGGHTMCQHDFASRRVFQHRNLDKWRLDRRNRRNGDFLFESECFSALGELAALRAGSGGQRDDARERALTRCFWHYERVGHDARFLELLPNGLVGRGAASCEQSWTFDAQRGVLALHGERPTCELVEEQGRFRGRWSSHERMPVIMTPFRVRSACDRGQLEEVWQHDVYGLRALSREFPELSRFAVLGARTGAVATWISQLWPGASVLAVESDPCKLPALVENCARFPRVVTLPGARRGAAEASSTAALAGELVPRSFGVPCWIHLDCGEGTEPVIQRLRAEGALEAARFISGEFSDSERIRALLGEEYALSAPETSDRIGSFLARRRAVA